MRNADFIQAIWKSPDRCDPCQYTKSARTESQSDLGGVDKAAHHERGNGLHSCSILVSIASSDEVHTFRVPVFLALLDLFTLPQDITYTNGDFEDLSSLDPEEAGFQSSFSKLGASEKSVHDPVENVPDEKLFASKELARRSTETPGVVSDMQACVHEKKS